MIGHESFKLLEARLGSVSSELRLPRRRIYVFWPRVATCSHWYSARVINDGYLNVEVLGPLRGRSVVGTRLLSPIADIDRVIIRYGELAFGMLWREENFDWNFGLCRGFLAYVGQIVLIDVHHFKFPAATTLWLLCFQSLVLHCLNLVLSV